MLVDSLEEESTLAAAARLVVPRLADWCTVDMLQPDGRLRRLAVAHVDPAKVALAEQLALAEEKDRRGGPSAADDAHGAAAVVRSGEPELIAEISDELLVAAVPDPELLATLRSWGCAPHVVQLSTRAHPGSMTFVAPNRSGATATPLAVAEEFARRAGAAIETPLSGRSAGNGTMERRSSNDLRLSRRKKRWRVSYTCRTTCAPPCAQRGCADMLERSALPRGRESDDTEPIRADRQMGKLTMPPGIPALDALGRPHGALDTGRGRRAQMEPAAGRARKAWQSILAGWSHPAMLRTVVANLVSNAVKYTRSRDVARIEIGAMAEDGGGADVTTGEIHVFVKDNGVGFNMEYAHKLFGVFQRLHADIEGTGIGLATVRRVLQRHGGRVWAEGREGEGATFFFALPRLIAPRTEP